MCLCSKSTGEPETAVKVLENPEPFTVKVQEPFQLKYETFSSEVLENPGTFSVTLYWESVTLYWEQYWESFQLKVLENLKTVLGIFSS